MTAYIIVDPATFADGGVIRQETFMARVQEHDWERYTGKNVLIRGCGDALVPPWAYMVLAVHLAAVAKTVRYGNEHDNLTVFRRKK